MWSILFGWKSSAICNEDNRRWRILYVFRLEEIDRSRFGRKDNNSQTIWSVDFGGKKKTLQAGCPRLSLTDVHFHTQFKMQCNLICWAWGLHEVSSTCPPPFVHFSFSPNLYLRHSTSYSPKQNVSSHSSLGKNKFIAHEFPFFHRQRLRAKCNNSSMNATDIHSFRAKITI